MRSSPASRTGFEDACPEGGGATGTIFNVQRFSIEDGPGIRTTVFIKGCPLRCSWCHNPEGLSRRRQLMWFDVRCIGARDCLDACEKGALRLTPGGMLIDRERCDGCGRCQEACPAGAIEVVGREVTASEVFEEVLRDEAFYRNSGGGLTVSGGEPTLQPAFAGALTRMAREAGIHVALDTCGYSSGEVLAGLLEHCDMVLLDLKLMDPARHRELTGAPLEPVLESARLITRSGKPLWVRTPVVPGCNDTEDDIRKIAGFVAGELGTVRRWDLLPFNNTCGSKYRRLGMEWGFEDAPLIGKAKMDALAAVAGEAGCKVEWSGLTGGDSD